MSVTTKRKLAVSSSVAGAAAVQAAVLVRRRFVEASRRAEMIALVNRTSSEAELATVVTRELCERLDAEHAFLLALRRRGRLEALGSTGLSGEQLRRVLEDPLLTGPLLNGSQATRQAETHLGDDLLGVGAGAAALAGSGWAILGVARRRRQRFDNSERSLLEAVAEGTEHALARVRLGHERDELFARLEETNVGIAVALAAALDAKDHYTADHARAVADLAVLVGVKMGMSIREARDLRLGAILHDIGKIAVPDAILNKPGRLTPEEFAIVKTHAAVGAQILEPVPFLDGVRRIVRHDHERWDGDGYPDGLRAEDIPLGARIVLVVDAFHAMTSDRPYRKAMDEDEAVGELRAGAGSQFDPAVVEAFVRVFRRPRRSTSAALPEAPRT